MVYQRTIDVKVLSCRRSNPALGDEILVMRENTHSNIVNYVDSCLVGEELWVSSAGSQGEDTRRNQLKVENSWKRKVVSDQEKDSRIQQISIERKYFRMCSVEDVKMWGTW